MGGGPLALIGRGTLPFGVREAEARARKREAAEIHAAQIGAAQIEAAASALVLVAPVHGASGAGALVVRQQPFDIVAVELWLDIEEGVVAVLDVGRDVEAAAQHELAQLGNLGLRAPGLVDTLPVGTHDAAVLRSRRVAWGGSRGDALRRGRWWSGGRRWRRCGRGVERAKRRDGGVDEGRIARGA